MGQDESKQARGGRARATALTSEEKKAIARKAALARWEKDVPRATHEGEFKLGESVVYAAILPNRKRLLTQATFLRALGRSERPKGGTGVFGSVDGIPSFLQADVLKPFITDELLESTTPIFFIDKTGKKSVGYDAKLLPNVADVYLKYRDARAAEGKVPDGRFKDVVRSCDAVMRGLANYGIVAMIDRATGFTDDLERDVVARLLEAYISDNLRPYARTFPVSWFKQVCRVKGIKFSQDMKLPRYFGKIVNDLVWDRLGPGVRQWLDERTPVGPNGRRKQKKFQWLTEEFGINRLLHHLGVEEGILMGFDDGDWKTFKARLNRVLPTQPKVPTLFDQTPEEPKQIAPAKLLVSGGASEA